MSIFLLSLITCTALIACGGSDGDPDSDRQSVGSGRLEFALNEDGKSYPCVGIGTYSGNGVTLDTYKGLPVTAIGEKAFYNCVSLESATIGNGVTSIGTYAFSDCTGLTSVKIGSGGTSIGRNAFSGCSSLTSIKYRGTEDARNNIPKGAGWNSGTGSYTLKCNYDGD